MTFRDEDRPYWFRDVAEAAGLWIVSTVTVGSFLAMVGLARGWW